MGQILVRKIDDAALDRLRQLAEDRKMSLEALARQALEREAERKTAKETGDLRSEFENFSKMLPKSDQNSSIILRALRDGDETDD